MNIETPRVAGKLLLRRIGIAAVFCLATYVFLRPIEPVGSPYVDVVQGPLAKTAAGVLLALGALRAAGKLTRFPSEAVKMAMTVSFLTLSFFAVSTAFAAGSGMPWEEPLQQVLESVQGPVAKIIAVIIIITTGLTLAFGETSGGFRRLIQIVFGLSIAFAASSFFLSFFRFGGGALVA